MIEFAVLSCLVTEVGPAGRPHGDPAGDPGDDPAAHPPGDPAGPATGRAVSARPDPRLAAAGRRTVHHVGPRPGKEIDPLLSGRILVVGDDADLAAVALRMVRRSLLGEVDVAFAPAAPTALTRLWSLPVGAEAVRAAGVATTCPVPLVRDDIGGVTVAAGSVAPLLGATYVDEHKVLAGPALTLQVCPDRVAGLAVTVVRRGALPWTRRSTTTLGRAVQIGSAVPATITRDGVEFARRMDRWTFYRHTEDLRLVGAAPPG